MKQPAEVASAHLGHPQGNPQFSVPVHSQMAHSGQHMQNFPANPTRDPYGSGAPSQYQSAMTYQTNIDRQVGNQQPERRQISGQQQIPPGHWQCQHCTSFNPYKYTVCQICCKSYDFQPEFNDVQQSQSSKQCPYCKQANRMQDVNCVGCGNSMIQPN